MPLLIDTIPEILSRRKSCLSRRKMKKMGETSSGKEFKVKRFFFNQAPLKRSKTETDISNSKISKNPGDNFMNGIRYLKEKRDRC